MEKQHAEKRVSFHNVTELEPSSIGIGGFVLRRFPASVRNDPALTFTGRHVTGISSNGCEIRFVAEQPLTRVYLATPREKARVYILRGEYSWMDGYVDLEGGKVNTITLQGPRPDWIDRAVFAEDRFPPELWRIYCMDAPVIFCGIDAEEGGVRPPRADELPARRWLAYGSSITQAGTLYVNYVNTAAQMLGVDALNLGMGGSCFAEQGIADFIAGRDDWDFATFELGVNMRDRLTPEEFGRRVRYLIGTVTRAHPEKPVVLMDVFRNGEDYALDRTRPEVRDNERFRRILAEAVAEHGGGNLHLLDALSVFPDLKGFQADLLHPMPMAFVRAGLRLAEQLRPLIGA